MPEPAAGVMRMSADDDDQADQKPELSDPGMAETDHSVLETTWPQLCIFDPLWFMQPVEDCKGVSDVVIASKPERHLNLSKSVTILRQHYVILNVNLYAKIWMISSVAEF